MPIAISGSVGRGGRNVHADVSKVQNHLNGLMPQARPKLAVDGLSGPKTEGAIREFQKACCGFRYGDGRIDVGGQTLRTLNDPSAAARWRGAPPSPGPTPPSVTPAGPETPGSPEAPSRGEAVLEQAATGLDGLDAVREFIVDVRNAYIAGVKDFIAGLADVAQATPLAKTIIWLRDIGYDRFQRMTVIREIVLARTFDFARMVLREISQAAQPVVTFFIMARNTALAKLKTILQTAFDLARASPLAAVARFFGELVGNAIDWRFAVGLFERVALMLGAAGSHVRKCVRLIKECDPLGLAQANLNAVASVVLGAVGMIERGLLSDSALGNVINRIRSIRNSLASELGDFLGATAAELNQWRHGNWTFIRTQIPNWISG